MYGRQLASAAEACGWVAASRACSDFVGIEIAGRNEPKRVELKAASALLVYAALDELNYPGRVTILRGLFPRP